MHFSILVCRSGKIEDNTDKIFPLENWEAGTQIFKHHLTFRSHGYTGPFRYSYQALIQLFPPNGSYS